MTGSDWSENRGHFFLVLRSLSVWIIQGLVSEDRTRIHEENEVSPERSRAAIPLISAESVQICQLSFPASVVERN